MAVRTRDAETTSGEHVVQFYEHDGELVEAVVPYLAAAAELGDVAIVIATEAHRRAFDAALEQSGVDVEEAKRLGWLVSVDAAAMLGTFAGRGEIDRDAFDAVIGGLVRRALSSGRVVRAYGEMVALLWEGGDVLGAIELETLWNELGRELSFSLFCAYRSAAVTGSEHAGAVHQICHLHSAVLQPAAESAPDAEEGGGVECRVEAEFPAEASAPGRARRLLTTTLREWGLDDDLVDDAALVVSELASNAVIHAASPFSISARVRSGGLRVSVEDRRRSAMALPEQELLPQPLHGLGVIDLISSDWGVKPTKAGKLVWVELGGDAAQRAAQRGD